MTVVYREINGQRFYTPQNLASFDYYRDYLLVRNFGELINANVHEQGSLAASLFGHWKLDSKDGNTLVDATGNGGDFTLYSGDMADLSIVSGYDGNAIRNSGSEVVVYAVGSSPYSIFTTNLSVSMRVYSTVVPVPNFMATKFFIDDEGYGGFFFLVYGSLYDDCGIYFSAKTDTGYLSASAYMPLGSSGFTVDTWHMVTVAIDMTSEDPIVFYLDDSPLSLEGGAPSGSGSYITYNDYYGNHKPLISMVNPVGTEFLDTDDLRFYSTTLTQENVTELYGS